VAFPSIFLLALGLAMDATAVAAARGVAATRVRKRDVLLVGLLFGGFQALMPALGWFLGAAIGRYIEAWDHWIAFTLLALIGAKMLWDARRGSADAATGTSDGTALFSIVPLVILAVATSIDALAAGFTLPLVNAPFATTIGVIGATTMVLSAAGLALGRRFGALLGGRLQLMGGLVLIGLGVKIVAEHMGLV
jgi:putative Mn2+ efflux pump MntP